MDDKPTQGATDNGLDPKVASLLAYLLGIVGGIVFYSISKDSYVRFHSMQSIIFSIAVAIVTAVFYTLSFASFLWMFTWLINLAVIVVWVMLMVKAYQGEKYKLPIIGDMAEKYAK